MNKHILHIVYLFVAMAFVSCATVVKPTGGPRDMTPPKIAEVNPPSGTTNFDSKKIEIEFNEYVVLDKLNEQLVVSPRMPEKPKISIKGKSVVVELPDSLAPNTTYSIYFGNAIVNYKEKVPAENVEYVFATGALLDSLYIQGIVVNAVDDSPAEKTFVLLYKADADSAIYKEKPYYLARVRPGGNFRLSSLGAGSYQIFALQDLNNNYIFDQIDEKMAFIDSLVVPYYEHIHNDTIEKDSLQLDTIEHEEVHRKPLRLSLFSPIPKNQTLLEYKTHYQNQAVFTFRKPTGNITIKAIDFVYDENWVIPRYGVNRDSFFVWFRHLPKDTFDIEIREDGVVMDTITLKFKAAEKKPLAYQSNMKSGMNFFDPAYITFKNPMFQIDTSRIKLIEKAEDGFDTIPFKMSCVNPDFETKYKLDFKVKEAGSYSLYIPDSVMFDIYGNSHDTIISKFNTSSSKLYGHLDLNIVYSGEYPLYIELLLDGKKQASFSSHSDTLITYPYLRAGKYTLKAVIDKNNNGKWDTGEFDELLQPERVLHLGKTINVRANWKIKHLWEIKI